MFQLSGEGTAIEKVIWAGAVQAIIVRASLPRHGYNFVSEPDDAMQLGVNHYDQGSVIKPHVHLPLERSLQSTAEMIHIDSGRCRVMFYNEARRRYWETEAVAGDTLLFLAGGHGFEILEPTRIIEIKQGPYLGPAKDKQVFQEEGSAR